MKNGIPVCKTFSLPCFPAFLGGAAKSSCGAVFRRFQQLLVKTSKMKIQGSILFFFSFKDFIYLFMRDTERQRHRQREKQAPSREPDVGLDARSPGPPPGPKAALNRWATQAYCNSFIVLWFMLLQVLPVICQFSVERDHRNKLEIRHYNLWEL